MGGGVDVGGQQRGVRRRQGPRVGTVHLSTYPMSCPL